jgi:2-oxoglutarate/2-oxoacid ferredoxin oxidoreductase subunit alpha
MNEAAPPARAKTRNEVEKLDSIVVRFAGDSGDGMQLTGTQFTVSTALFGSDLATFPDFPAEIRAPAGTTFGVSAYQINFGANEILTAGDEPDVLVAMNPAALKVNIGDLREGGMVIADTGAFTARNLQKAGFEANPLEGDGLAKYHVMAFDISAFTVEAVKPFNLGNKEALRCKNMWTLGLVLWMFGRKRKPITDWLKTKFAKNPEIAEANIAALNAGHAFGETAEIASGFKRFHIGPAKTEPGTYRTVTGSETLAWGLAAAAQLSGLKLVFGSYPITPASPLLHILSNLKQFGIVTFQAEDEIAAICAALGAAYGGALAVTSSSGPGIALKTEALGLGISTELPLVVVNSQRGGPSTGLPTKTEQSDLYQAVYGRNADSPLPVIASRSPGDCFYVAIEAARIALKYMTPVMLLTDGYLANAAEPWKLPELAKLETIPVTFAEKPNQPDGGFNPYSRDPKTLARAWARPGTPKLMHRIGGLEKSFETGHISYDPANHQKMTETRFAKIKGIENDIPLQDVASGGETGDLAVVGWGSTFGPIQRAVMSVRASGQKVSHIHIRYLNPFPKNLGPLLKGFRRVLVPEMNMGQLSTLLRDRYLLDVKPLTKVSGQPFKIREIDSAIRATLSEGKP